MSDENCKNDCTTPLRFPRRPGTEPPSVHGQGCSCCAPSEQASADNRPSLNHFNYRIGTYGSIREFLFHQINRTPELLNWTHRAPDDPAVALLEGAAILGDILTFYQDTYANEAFLRTARWRESISDLVRLLGYRLSPAVGGNTVFAFEIKKDEPVTIPAGFPLKATLKELPKPADFETKKEIIAYPWLGRFNLFRPLAETQFAAEFEIVLPEQLVSPVEIKPGERLIIGQSSANWPNQPLELANAETVIVDSVRERHGTKIYKVKGDLKFLSGNKKVFAYRIGRTFHHFGYNSPAKIVDNSQPITSTATVTPATNSAPAKTETSSTIPYLTVPFVRPVNGDSGKFSDAVVTPAIADNVFPLELELQDLPVNVPVIIQARFDYPHTKIPVAHHTLVRTIKNIGPVTQTWGGANGTVSKIGVLPSISDSFGSGDITLDAADKKAMMPGDKISRMHIDDALFHEVTSPLLEIKAARTETSGATGNTLNFYGTADQVTSLKGRRIMLDKEGVEPRIVSVTQTPSSFDAATKMYARLYSVTLSGQVAYSDYPNEDPLVTVFGNLVDADEGKTLPEISIGDGDALQIFQNFKLPKTPLTYHIVPENTPSETPEAEVYVDGRLWRKVDSFFGHGGDEHIYIVREDAAGNSWVQFGDGKTGARLTGGTKNVTVRYRTGDGAYGPLKEDTKVQASAKLKNLDKVQMPMDATGGAQPEDGENARNAAPGKVQSLGRIVSLKDFESEAIAIPGVAAASAAWQLQDNVPAVVVTILMETGRSTEIGSVRETLNSYNFQRGAGRNAVYVDPGKRMYTMVSLEYALKPTYRADLVEPEIRRALGTDHGNAVRDEDQTGLFSLYRRQLGGREYASSIEGWAQNVEGVLWARAVAFDALTDTDDPDSITLPSTFVFKPVTLCDSGHVLSLYDKHLILKPITEEGS